MRVVIFPHWCDWRAEIFHLSSLFMVWTTSDDLETWTTLTNSHKIKLDQLGLWKSLKYWESYRWFHFGSVWLESVSTFVHHPHVNSQGLCLMTTEFDKLLRTSQLPILQLLFGEKGSGFEWTMSAGVSRGYELISTSTSRSRRAYQRLHTEYLKHQRITSVPSLHAPLKSHGWVTANLFQYFWSGFKGSVPDMQISRWSHHISQQYISDYHPRQIANTWRLA
jgi:hypothetical protein